MYPATAKSILRKRLGRAAGLIFLTDRADLADELSASDPG
jgi:hypothetical protein